MNKFIFTTIFLVFLASSCNSKRSSGQEVPIITDSTFTKATALFKNNCSGCHGMLMQAFVDRDWKYGNSADSIYNSIHNGRGEGATAMPTFGEFIPKEDIQALVEYIRYGIENINEYQFSDNHYKEDTLTSGSLKFTTQLVISDFESPWGIAFIDAENMIVTDKNGELWRVTTNGDKVQIVNTPEVLYKGQGGLLDVELHPDFSNNHYIYLSYSIFKNSNGRKLSSTAVSRYTLKGNRLEDEKMIFEATPYVNRQHHYGSRIEFDNEGYLYITIGDRGNRDENPQSLERYPGKVHRFNDDGSIPGTNPFYNSEDAIKSIYTYGHRNPQGMSKHPTTGEIWIHEHGPRGGDELNILKPGANYGWPVISYGINYNGTTFTNLTEMEGMEQPITYWVPSIAPCGMDFIRGDKYKGWERDLLVGSLRFEYVNLCKLDGDKVVSEEKLFKNIGRVRVIKQAPDGYIYIGVENPGRIYKIVPLNE